MSFVRIYQGRITSVTEVISEKKGTEEFGEGIEESRLTEFHELFTDAINYYLLAIGAMVRGSEEERLKNFVARLDECWKPYSKKGKHYEGICAGFVRSLNLKHSLDFSEACDLLLENKDEKIEQEILRLAGESLLFDLGGEGKIQQGSKTYLPLFCASKTTANFPRGPVNRLKSEGKILLPSLLWADDAEDSLERLVEKLPFEYFANPNTNGTRYSGEGARQRLREAVEGEQEHEEFSPRLVKELRESIESFSDDLSFPKYTGGSVNKEALLRRLNVYLLLRFVSPVAELFERMKSLIKKPTKFVKEFQMDEMESRLHQLGEDPIKLARGNRGYVFPAFSSLPIWKEIAAGEFSFKGFDIQAFAEALKGISQYQMMTVKRAGERALEKGRSDWIRGTSDVQPKNEDGEIEVLPKLGGDVRFERLEMLLKGQTDDEGGELTVRRLRPRGFRGYREIREAWLKVGGEAGTIDPSVLKQAVAKVQQAQPRLIGDTTLFEALTKPENQIVWQPPLDEERAHDVVNATLKLSEIERKHDDLSRPVKLSPAHATLSRRQFLFSDLTGSSKELVSFEDAGGQFAVVSIACLGSEGWAERRVRLDFSAPRIERDGLGGGKGADWLPPMMKALGVEATPPDFSKVAVALMPHKKSDEEMIHLLNFPLTLDFSGKKEAGLQRVDWVKQLNGTLDQKLHVHAPDTLSKTSGVTPWFQQDAVKNAGLQILGVDLGQRVAAACALVELNGKKKAGRMSKRPIPVVDIGLAEIAGNVSEARVIRTTSIRLPGEDRQVLIDGKWQQEHYGSRGRMATEEEYQEAIEIEALLGEEEGAWVGSSSKKFSFPEQNDKLLKVIRVLMSRRRSLYRISWKHFKDQQALREALAQVQGEGDLAERAQEESVGLGELLEQMRERYDELGAQLTTILEKIGNRVLPVHGHCWCWQAHGESGFKDKGWHELVAVPCEHRQLRIKGQRGLSMNRIEQVTAFRKCLLSFNRSGLEEFGQKPEPGENWRDESTPEPCPSILKRLDELRDQRIKQTAHGIIQEALGLRLLHQSSRPSRGDVHGAYERVTGRRSVDLIVLENMQRYRASQGRGKWENSSLMQWCHRAILDKVKEMAKPFGLQIVEVQPDYSSRFHALTGNVGFRANRISRRDAESEWASYILKKEGKRTEKDRFIRDLFLKHQEAAQKGVRLPALFYYQVGGTDFVGIESLNGKLSPLNPYQADLNAAANLAIAAVAAPTAFNIFRKVRLERKGKKVVVVRSNKREKAAFPSGAEVSGGGLSPKVNQNAFFDHGDVSEGPSLDVESVLGKLVTSFDLFSEVKRWSWEMCRLLNNRILNDNGLSEMRQRSIPNRKMRADIDEEEDELPM